MTLWRPGLALTLAALALPWSTGCDRGPPVHESRAEEPSRSADDFAGVDIGGKSAQQLGLELAPVASSRSVAAMHGMAVVLDSAALAAVLADLDAARADAEVARDNFNRLQHLYADDGNASRQAVEAASTQWAAARARVTTIEARARSDWGVQVSDATRAHSDLLHVLANEGDVLLRADFPETLPAPVEKLEYALFGSSPDEATERALHYIGRSRAPAMTASGDSVMLKLNGNSGDTFAFRTGLRIPVLASRPGAASRPLVPAAAAIADGGRLWCYVSRKEGRFDRIPLSSTDRVSGGYPVAAGIKEGDLVVVRGAPFLLSLERGSGTVPDEGD